MYLESRGMNLLDEMHHAPENWSLEFIWIVTKTTNGMSIENQFNIASLWHQKMMSHAIRNSQDPSL